tara:strand:+ start:173 stop:427 length:255 start_codon:yes stop_codon:yes gene_type:complete
MILDSTTKTQQEKTTDTIRNQERISEAITTTAAVASSTAVVGETFKMSKNKIATKEIKPTTLIHTQEVGMTTMASRISTVHIAK